MKHARMIAVLTALGIGTTTAVLARGPGWEDSAGPGGDCPMAGAKGMKQRDPAARAEDRLVHLKNDLKITPEQEQAWESFATVYRAEMGSLPPPPRFGADAAPQAAPEAMTQRLAFMQQRLAHMQNVSKALQELYGQLTPEQKTAADRVFSRPGPGH